MLQMVGILLCTAALLGILVLSGRALLHWHRQEKAYKAALAKYGSRPIRPAVAERKFIAHATGHQPVYMVEYRFDSGALCRVQVPAYAWQKITPGQEAAFVVGDGAKNPTGKAPTGKGPTDKSRTGKGPRAKKPHGGSHHA